MKLVKTVDAIGKTICHDITQIVKDDVKGVLFKKGHIVKEEDIPLLHSVGKFNLYIWEDSDNVYVHENEAARVLIDLCKNSHMYESGVKEGKIDLFSDIEGLFKVNTALLKEMNCFDQIMVSTIHNYYPVKKGEKILGTRIIPLMIEEEKLLEFSKIVNGQTICELLEYKIKKCAVITTGTEVFTGIIKDTFTPVIENKLKEYGAEIVYHKIIADNLDDIKKAIKECKDDVDMIICTGGMSVDPDDLTPKAIKESGANLISYGSPVLPGAMFLLAYFDDKTPVLGLPGCVMYNTRTVFDILLPRILCKEEISKEDIAALGNGGLCMGCDFCHFPNCQFGKGV